MSIYLIRHGRTEANLHHLYCGSTDLPLTPEGIAELKKLRYSAPGCQFVTSGMLRTEQTLQTLFGDVPHRREPRLREIDFGSFEMLDYEALKDREDYQAWITGDNQANVAPGGESGIRMRLRVLEAFREISDNTVIITHGGPIAAIMSSLFPEENKNLYQWQPRPGQGYKITCGSYIPIPEEDTND